MKALSILQPWAWLIVHGPKPVENRTWSTRVRGPILIHAGKRWGTEQKDDLAYVRTRFPHIDLPESYDLGGVVGKATLIDCVSSHPSPWFAGPYGFVLADAVTLPFHPCRGQLGFFELPSVMGETSLNDGGHVLRDQGGHYLDVSGLSTHATDARASVFPTKILAARYAKWAGSMTGNVWHTEPSIRAPNAPPTGGYACTQCGCTDLFACPQGCSWSRPHLCSTCDSTRNSATSVT